MLLLEDKIAKLAKSVCLSANDNFDEYWDDPVDSSLFGRGYYANSGASKRVYLIEGSAAVLKIPFKGSWESVYNGDTDRYDEIFSPFENADEDTHWNYCEVEASYYDRAKEEHLEKYFAKTQLFGTTKNGYPLYIQERCKYYGSSSIIPSKETSSRVSEMFEKDYYYIEDEEWAATFIECYGEDEFFRLVKFLDSLKGINDLTCRNVGYTLEGKPVLIDFSGFND